MSKRGWLVPVVAASLAVLAVNGEHESEGSTGRAAATARDAATPFFSEVIGFLGDLLLIGRDEASRQGIDPTAVFQPSDGGGELQPPSGPPDVPSLGGE